VIVKPSSFGYAETVQRLSDALEERALTVFARVDHAGLRVRRAWTSRTRRSSCSEIQRGDAADAGGPRIGIELPLRILIWRGSEHVVLGYHHRRRSRVAPGSVAATR
jgi:uncharacterized protein (DUF302 family)